jgi:hypothetical protein
LPERLIQLVPRFRPDADGLGEFALCLGDALWRRCGVRSDFVVWSPPRTEQELAVPCGDGFPHHVYRADKRQRKVFAERLQEAAALSRDPVALLHYTSYAYSRQGIAWWLPGVLREFIGAGGRVVCFFHELYAVGKFPNKTWLSSGLQRHIFREVLALSSAAISSNANYMEQMARDNRSGRPLALAGICSNVGEAKTLPPASGRKRRLAVFGLHPSRRRLYEQHLPLLLRLVAHLGVEEVADIGALGEWPQLLEEVREQLGKAGVRLNVCGSLPAEEVGSLLAGSLAGAVNYSSGMHLKSGIVGAYQAYGLPVILFRPEGDKAPAADDSVCLSPQTVLDRKEGLEQLLTDAGRAGFEFYREHRSYDAVLEQVLPWLHVRSKPIAGNRQ